MSSQIFRIKAVCMAILLVSSGVAVAQSSGDARQTFTGLQLRGDQPIAIEANQLDVDDRNTVATFTGNVSVKQGDVQLSSGKLIVYYRRDGSSGNGTGNAEPASAPGTLPGGSSQIERLEATNNVYVKSADQVATANQADFEMAKQLVTLTGNVVLTQGENVAEGCRLTISMDTGVARLESQSCGKNTGGRVRLMLTPGQSGSGQGSGR
ncbi:lipopolysaccharide transport periplasmic protein LptA [Aurantimonas sp. 22II-16-19i]|uniref:lipopolysaccharide transport periplasmic protein LptA n=1 Tax=Aurantimonas sp. 22II-16-19i TaxID=1317114 RepID=UPI0009F7EABF|nr:lipopolysaccharide transport periplasmic protein LptA [Aurantimonas sp. 22II-16-19i]ORE92828.1 OstA family protein [Aurantimonas sp. 22II-16-19i]